eukprot:IDg9964t1
MPNAELERGAGSAIGTRAEVDFARCRSRPSTATGVPGTRLTGVSEGSSADKLACKTKAEPSHGTLFGKGKLTKAKLCKFSARQSNTCGVLVRTTRTSAHYGRLSIIDLHQTRAAKVVSELVPLMEAHLLWRTALGSGAGYAPRDAIRHGASSIAIRCARRNGACMDVNIYCNSDVRARASDT